MTKCGKTLPWHFDKYLLKMGNIQSGDPLAIIYNVRDTDKMSK